MKGIHFRDKGFFTTSTAILERYCLPRYPGIDALYEPTNVKVEGILSHLREHLDDCQMPQDFHCRYIRSSEFIPLEIQPKWDITRRS